MKLPFAQLPICARVTGRGGGGPNTPTTARKSRHLCGRQRFRDLSCPAPGTTGALIFSRVCWGPLISLSLRSPLLLLKPQPRRAPSLSVSWEIYASANGRPRARAPPCTTLAEKSRAARAGHVCVRVCVCACVRVRARRSLLCEFEFTYARVVVNDQRSSRRRSQRRVIPAATAFLFTSDSLCPP